MGYFIHLHVDKEFDTQAARDAANIAIAKVMSEHGFVKGETDLQAREEKTFTADDGTKVTHLVTVTVAGAELARPVIAPDSLTVTPS